MIKLAHRLWHSPVFTSWGSIGMRMLSLILVLPIVLREFPAADIAVWQLFSTIITIQLLLDFGLAPTFSRLISYSNGGAGISDFKRIQNGDPREQASPKVNESDITEIYGTLKWVYARFGILILTLTATAGTFALDTSINQMENPKQGWTAWIVLLLTAIPAIWVNASAAAIQGLNAIAVLRRWEMLTALCQIATSFSVVLLGGTLLHLVLATQAWVLFSLWRNLGILYKLKPALRNCKSRRNRELVRTLWPATWKSGAGIIMSQGIIQMSGLVYSQIAPASSVASYLLALRVITTISQISSVPFYTKIPTLASLLAKQDNREITRIAQKGMFVSSWVYFVGVTLCGATAGALLEIIGSKISFVDSLTWALIAIAFLIERIGAMHIQLYSITNNIIWHIANGITGATTIILSFILYQNIGIIALPLAMIISYIALYVPIAMTKSSSTFRFRVISFEIKANGPAAVATLVALTAIFAFQSSQ